MKQVNNIDETVKLPQPIILPLKKQDRAFSPFQIGTSLLDKRGFVTPSLSRNPSKSDIKPEMIANLKNVFIFLFISEIYSQ